MEIKQLKKELDLKNRDLAKLFGQTLEVFQNTSSKKRYEKALCDFYQIVKEKQENIEDGILKKKYHQ